VEWPATYFSGSEAIAEFNLLPNKRTRLFLGSRVLSALRDASGRLRAGVRKMAQSNDD